MELEKKIPDTGLFSSKQVFQDLELVLLHRLLHPVAQLGRLESREELQKKQKQFKKMSIFFCINKATARLVTFPHPLFF